MIMEVGKCVRQKRVVGIGRKTIMFRYHENNGFPETQWLSGLLLFDLNVFRFPRRETFMLNMRPRKRNARPAQDQEVCKVLYGGR
jgi:hypothetical protein